MELNKGVANQELAWRRIKLGHLLKQYFVSPTVTKRIIVRNRTCNWTLEIDTDKVKEKKVKFLANKISRLNSKVNTNDLAKAIVKLADTEGIDPFIVGAIIHAESNFNHKARSYKGALGLMQLLPSTANLVASRKHTREELHSPEYNIKLGIVYMKQMLNLFGGNLEKALMAYNWGPVHLAEALRHKRSINPGVVRYAKSVTRTYITWNKEFKGN